MPTSEEKNLKIIEKTVSSLLDAMEFSSKVKVEKDDKDNITCNITIDDGSNLLIGQYGTNLQALQHIARLLVRKSIEERLRFIVDVNSYRQERNLSLIEQARSLAQQAVNEKRSFVMRPTSTYERRLVHMELASNDQVSTESIGEGEGRKIVINPIGII